MSRRRSDPKYDSFKAYSVYLRRHLVPFRCPECGSQILSKNYEQHCASQHGFDPALSCVWCSGRRFWNKGEKYRNVDHLNSCWRDFMSQFNPPRPPSPAPPSPEPPSPAPPLPGPLSPPVPEPVVVPPINLHRPADIPFDSSLFCPKEDAFGIEELALDRAHDLIWPMPLSPNLYVYEDNGVNLGVSCIQAYLQLQSTMDFYHIMVRAVAYPSFLQAMDRDEGRTRTLPFSTWCNGGHLTEASLRQHRHMIAVSPKGHFQRNVWSKITIPPETRPFAHYKCILKKLIKEPMHLVNMLGYVSKRESQCTFCIREEEEEGGEEAQPGQLNHFWISTALPRDYRIPLALEWDGGVLKLFDQVYRHFGLDRLLRLPLLYQNQRWKIAVRDLPGIRLGLVLPLHPDWSFSLEPTSVRLYLFSGRELYLQRAPGLAPQPFHAVRQELFTFRKYHQMLLNNTKAVHDQNERLETENTQLRWTVHALNTKVLRGNRTVLYWKRNAERWRREMDLQQKIKRTTEKEIGRLERENEKIQEELAQSRSENEKIQEELAQSRREIEELKHKLAAYR